MFQVSNLELEMDVIKTKISAVFMIMKWLFYAEGW